MEAILLTTFWFAEWDAMPSAWECDRQVRECERRLALTTLRWDERPRVRELRDWWVAAHQCRNGVYFPPLDDRTMQELRDRLGADRWWARDWPYAIPPEAS